MKLKFIGTGTFTSKNRALTSMLINNGTLFDAGGGTVRGLQEYGVDITKIKHIIITHRHVDHLLDVPNLLMRRRLGGNEDKKLTIIGPKGIKKIILDTMEILMAPLFKPVNIEFIEMKEEKLTIDDMQIISHSVKHGPFSPVYGYEMVIDGCKLGFGGDATKCDGLDGIVRNSEYCFLDTNRYDDSDEFHLNTGGGLLYAKKYPHKKFYFVHRSDYELDDLPENVFMPNDGEEIEL